MVKKLVFKLTSSQKFKILQSWYEKNAQEHVHDLLLTGPSLLGWLYGVMKYEPDHANFSIALRSLQLFLMYIIFLSVNSFLSFADIFSYSKIEVYLESLAALFYIILHIFLYLNYKKGKTFALPLEQKFQAGISGFITGK